MGWQVVLAYLLVAASAAWIVWSILLPRKLRARLKGRVRLARR